MMKKYHSFRTLALAGTVMAVAVSGIVSSAYAQGSLGDAVRRKAEQQQAPDETVLRSVKAGRLRIDLMKVDLTTGLYLPDCAFGGETYSAPDGSVILLVQGRVCNVGNKAAHFQIPDFVSSSGKAYEEEDSVRYATSKSDMLSLELNPGAEHRFVCFFILPVEEVVGGRLRFEHELINWDDEYSYIQLPIDESASLQENIILRNVKDM